VGGQRIAKGEGGGKQKPRGEIDAFLEREEDPDYWLVNRELIDLD
jgi:hypothetical protein